MTSRARSQRPRAGRIGALITVGLLISACGNEAQSGSAGLPRDAVSVAATASPTPHDASSDDSTGAQTTMDDVTQSAVDQLVAKLGVGADAVTVVSSEPVTWRDGSLGCPKKGMGYTQMLVSGHLVILEVEGTTYRYHAGGNGAPFLCEGEAQDPLPAGDGPA